MISIRGELLRRRNASLGMLRRRFTQIWNSYVGSRDRKMQFFTVYISTLSLYGIVRKSNSGDLTLLKNKVKLNGAADIICLILFWFS